jgi:formate dehydrogenase iron-sulfur subunit
MSKAILYDMTKCIGCRQCEAACAERWGLSYEEPFASQEKLSEHKLTAIRTYSDGHFSRKLCMHCADPTCASVCPVGAFKKTKLGPVVYDEDKCIGCRYCMLACPFEVPVYEWTHVLPRVRKCDMCHERLGKGQATACSEACPTDATITGEREELIAEARRRIAESPGDYYDHIYGIEEVGGTSVLMLSPVPFEQLGMRADLPKGPLPSLTWQALAHVPDVVTVGSVLLGGVWWITHRREEVEAAEGKNSEARRKERER